LGLNRVLGQDIQIAYLRKLLETRNIPSTLIFAGPKGIGKTFTAMEFTKALNCSIDPLNGCDTCKSCLAIENRVHPNLTVIDSDTIGIDNVRDVINNSYIPVNGYKVNIFVDVENATIQALNSMLKFLEEPPQKTVNILVTEHLEALPETVASRGVIIRFRKLPTHIVKRLILPKVENEERATTLAHILNGSLKNADKLIKEDTFKKRKQMLLTLLHLLKKKESATTLISKMKDYYGDFNADTANDFIDEGVDLLKDILLIVGNKETERIKNIDLLGFIADEFLVGRKDAIKIYFEIFSKAKEYLLTNANPLHIILSVVFTIENL